MHRQCSAGGEETIRHLCRRTCWIQKRCRFPDDSPTGHNDTCKNAGHGRRQHHPEYRSQFACP